jgi:predicted outer membrane repeat protein
MNMKRFTLMLAGVLCASASFATDYYVSVDGSGEKSGSSWENAIAFTEMYSNINTKYKNGDVFYFQGGTYYVPAKVPTVSNGYSFIGATTGTPTVFSGDVNGDGVATEGDASTLLFIQLATKNGDTSKHFVLKNITFTGAYVNQTRTSALRVDNSGWVDVQNCIFDKNISVYSKDNNHGGPACLLERSTVNFTDCKFTNNESVGRGGAIKLTSDVSTKGYTNLLRCLVSGNKAKTLGSAIFFNHGQELNIINSVIIENVSGTEGEVGAIFSIGADSNYARQITLINSTVAGNMGGAQVLGRKDAAIRIANSIIVGDGTTPAISLQEKPKQVLSKGYNIIGMYQVDDASTTVWKTSDFVSDDNTLNSIFGNNAVTNGPVAAPYGATQVQMEAIAKGWSLGQDLKQDINGVSRGDIAVPGAVVAEPLKGKFGITDAKYATYYHDFGYMMPEGVKGGVVTDAKVEGTLVVDYKYGSGSVVPAKSALLLNGAKNDYEVALKLEETTEDVNLLKGTSDESLTTSDEAGAKFYKFANDKDKGIGFYWGAENGAAFTNSANKAYLAVAGEASAAKGFALGGVDTGIKEVTEVGKMAGKIYNLQGMQQKGLQKGICIVNGKKFVVK